MNELFPVINCKSIRGQLAFTPVDKAKLLHVLTEMPGDIQIIIRRPPKPMRSELQNKYYWGVVIDVICQTTGEIPRNQHEQLKKLFGIKSTTGLSTAAFAEYIEQIQAWASTEHNIYIPDPDKVSGWDK